MYFSVYTFSSMPNFLILELFSVIYYIKANTCNHSLYYYHRSSYSTYTFMLQKLELNCESEHAQALKHVNLDLSPDFYPANSMPHNSPNFHHTAMYVYKCILNYSFMFIYASSTSRGLKEIQSS